MPANVTVYDFMRRFESELLRMEQTDPEYSPGPYFPMLAAFLGDDAIRIQKMISRQMNQFWPRFGPELTFLGIQTPSTSQHSPETNSSGVTYTHLFPAHSDPASDLIDNSPLSGNPSAPSSAASPLNHSPANVAPSPEHDTLSPQDLNQLVSSLFSPDAPFIRYDRMLVYEFLDTTSFTSAAQIRQWFDALRIFRRDLHMEPGRMSELLFVLLDEAPEKRPLAAAIRRELANCLTEAEQAAEHADSPDIDSGTVQSPDNDDDLPENDNADSINADSIHDNDGDGETSLANPESDPDNLSAKSDNSSDDETADETGTAADIPESSDSSQSPDKTDEWEEWGEAWEELTLPSDVQSGDDPDGVYGDNSGDTEEYANSPDSLNAEPDEPWIECPAIFILSSHRSDRRIAAGPVLRGRLACAVMTLSDSPDTELSEEIFTPALLTAAYAREEKPVRAISQLCVTQLLAELQNASSPQSPEPPHALDDFRARLGISEDGSFVFFDNYVSETLSRFLPTHSQLTRFPFFSPGEELRLETETVSAAQFNEWTFGAWNCWLTGAVRRAQEQIRRDMADFRRWREQYANLLRSRFTADELIWLSANPHRAAKLLSSAQVPSRDLPVLEYAQAWLKYMVSSAQGLTGVLREEIEKQGEQARLCRKQWDSLSREAAALRPIRDETMARAYKRVLQGYFDACRENLIAAFRAAKTPRELLDLLENTLQSILNDRTLGLLFHADLAEELEYRVRVARMEAQTARKRGQSPANRSAGENASGENSADDMEGIREETEERIRRHLCDAPVYLPVSNATETSLCRCVLVDLETSLYDELADNLPEDTLFYDTGRSGAAEFLELFRLNPDAL